MRSFGRFLGRLLLLLCGVIGAMWIFGPYETISVIPDFDPAVIGDDPAGYLATQEARFDDITPGTEKRIIWAGDEGARTDKVIVYVHGFSATSEEIRPVPDLVAAEIGANLVYTRLAGHGRGGAAMVEGSAKAWMTDLAEALAVARLIGDEVVIMATSTGATVAAEAALQPQLMQDVAGLILISPNFALGDPASAVLTLPAARHWVPMVAGTTRSWTPQNDLHGTYWTTSYPTEALFQMAALVKHAAALPYQQATVPALFWYAPTDQVVDHSATDRIANVWGGPAVIKEVTVAAGDDPYDHVIAGDVLSPSANVETVSAFVNWINGLE
ncbi:alpha/beta fold hydrolase [Shimia sp. SDUM112013]|uniref:alpha/beta hydrolase n=1 Tax=Shimia sp. SDUM112013 TaxID=3136160 RepID=UPI0032ECAC3E